MTLGELIYGLGLHVHAGVSDPLSLRVCDITEDSRTAMPGSLFIARPGTKTDGRRYIGAAVEAGAEGVLMDAPPDGDLLRSSPGVVFIESRDVPRDGAAIAERFYGSPTSKLKLVGITGTNGKTTTAHAVHQALNSAGRRCGLIGTVSVDDGRELAEAVMTTPPACELSATFATMLEHGCSAAAMEVSSHALDQRRVSALKFAVAVFTNLTGDHLDYHGTTERYADAKAMLFESLSPDAVAVVNADDPWSERMTRRCSASVWTCSQSGGATCVVRAGASSVDGTPAVFAGPWGEFETVLKMVGKHNLMNALQAVAASHAAGLGLADLRHAVSLMVPPPGRLERVTVSDAGDDGFAVFVDYAHSDDALANVLRAARPLVTRPGAKLRVVFGCGGDRDRTKRPRMAGVCCELADHVVITSDNPRTEQPSGIIDEILSGVPDAARSRVVVEADRRRAIGLAIQRCAPGDVLIVAGKGHENYQLLPDGAGGVRRIDFDDRLVAREALRRRAASVTEGAGA